MRQNLEAQKLNLRLKIGSSFLSYLLLTRTYLQLVI